MTIIDAKRDLLEAWMVQRSMYPELDDADAIDLLYDLKAALETVGTPTRDIPTFIRSPRNKALRNITLLDMVHDPPHSPREIADAGQGSPTRTSSTAWKPARDGSRRLVAKWKE
jgi:hypothetical protein